MSETSVNVYVPEPRWRRGLSIKDGSGIVGTPTDNGFIVIDFEGNLYGAENVDRLARLMVMRLSLIDASRRLKMDGGGEEPVPF